MILDNEYILFDGAMGTMLQRAGFGDVPCPDALCLSEPETITAIHRAYVQAGSCAVTTNTFGANRMKLEEAGVGVSVAEIYGAAVQCARNAGARYVAADIGPIGELIEPYGDLEEDEAGELFAEQARAAQDAGADLVIIETMADLNEAGIAVEAVKRETSLPVFATLTFTATGRTFMGVSAADAVEGLEALGVDALGVNCSVGPADLQPVVLEMLKLASCPVIVQANAGLPVVAGGETTYTIGPAEYAEAVDPMIDAGARIIGGCCGTTPDYIRELAKLLP